MYKIIRWQGRANVIRIVDGACVPPNNEDFLDWNAKQPTPLDLSDKPPDPPPVDQDLERIKEILARFDAASPAERWEAVLKFMRKRLN